MNIRTARRNM